MNCRVVLVRPHIAANLGATARVMRNMGLTDLVLTNTTSNQTSLFVNRGTYFQEVAVAGLRSVDSFTSKPVVGDFSGTFTVYRNIGTAKEPKYAAGEKLKAGGALAKVPIY